MMVFMWPLALVVETMQAVGCNKRCSNVALLFRQAWQKLPRLFYLIVLLFYPLWIASHYCYARALRHVQASTMASIFGSCSAFVLIEERILLQQPWTIVRTFAVLLAFGGVVAYGVLAWSSNHGSVDGSTRHNTVEDGEPLANSNNNNVLLMGVLLGTCSSLAAATYKVAFKKFIGSPNRIDVCLFLSVLGFVNGVIGAVPTFALAHWGVEEPFYDTDVTSFAWGAIWFGSVFILVFNASVAFGIAVTSPLFIAVGTVLTIPVTVAIDYFLIHSDKAFVGSGQIAASASIVSSFLLIVIFDRHSVAGSTESESEDSETASNPSDNEEPFPIANEATSLL
jgi:solute carrier family 35 protein F3/4